MTRQANTLSAPIEHEQFAWLDALAEPLQAAAHKLFRSSKAGMVTKSLLNGTPVRHRVHPALIIVPLGAWTTAAFLDFLDAMQPEASEQTYGPSADASIALGLVSAVPVIAAGIADWVDTYDQHRRVGMAHALVNSVALTLYGVSLGLRLASGERRGLARVVGALGYGAVMLGGALGGELVYNLGVNVPWTLYPKLPNEWLDVLASEDLPEGKRRVVDVDRVPVLLYCLGGEIYAVEAWCPHAGGPLIEGTFEGHVVECPWHQSRFDLKDGHPMQGPASSNLRTFAVREDAGRIHIQPSYEGQNWPPAPKPMPETAGRVRVETAD